LRSLTLIKAFWERKVTEKEFFLIISRRRKKAEPAAPGREMHLRDEETGFLSSVEKR